MKDQINPMVMMMRTNNSKNDDSIINKIKSNCSFYRNNSSPPPRLLRPIIVSFDLTLILDLIDVHEAQLLSIPRTITLIHLDLKLNIQSICSLSPLLLC